MRAFLFFLFLLQYLIGFAQTRPVFWHDSCDFSALGHRGYPLIFPENTLLSLEMAFRHGVKICEVDVSVTSDDQYVLFHDEEALYRTTNGTGRIIDITYDSLKLLDAGSWKGSEFKNIHVPTLEEAILVAQKYKAQLYLDTKAYRPDLMKKALETTGADPERIIVPLTSVAEAIDFHAVLPQTPWVWYDGGLYPQNINDNQFYIDCINNGCIAFEVSGFDDTDTLWSVFENKVHAHGGKTWVFTDNTNERALYLYQKNVNGIETDRGPALNRYLCGGVEGAFPDSFTTGNWRFTTDMHSSGVGSQLRPRDYMTTPSLMQTSFGTCTQFGIATLDSSDEDVMLIPAQDSANGLLVYTGFVPEEFGTREGSYTVMMDFLVPASAANKWVALFQTTTLNDDDADLFINPAGQIGTVGDYHGQMVYDQWNRLVFTVDREHEILKKYLNGTYIGSSYTYGIRWTVANASPRGENQGFLIFSDNNGETETIYLSALQIRDYIMDSTSITTFGAPSRSGFKSGNADLFNVAIEGAIADSTLIDYDNQVYYLMVPAGFDRSQCKLSFDLSAQAKATIASGSTVNISSGKVTMQVVSEDSLRFKTWTIVVDETTNTGINKPNKTEEELWVYPNPTNDMLTIKNNGIATYTFYDAFGRACLTGMVQLHAQSIQISALPVGMYFLTVQSQTGEYKTTKVLIQR